MSFKLNKTCLNCSWAISCKEKGITDPCVEWRAEFEYFQEICSKAPWYIVDNFNKGRDNSWGAVIEKLDKENQGEAVEINLYDAIEKVYGLNILNLAEILGVSVGVVARAQSRYTPEKRIDHFAATLKIPVDFFYRFTNKDLSTLESCFEEFKKSRVLV